MTGELAADDPRHGTDNAYKNLRCRCKPCRDASTAKRLGYKAISSMLGMDPDDPRHGTENGYGNLGCRCYDCRTARNAADRARKDRARKRAVST